MKARLHRLLIPFAFAFATLVTAAAQAAPPKIVLCGASSSQPPDVKAKLVASGLFTAVDIIDVTSTTPTVNDLKAYDAVLVWSYITFKDATAFGNVLADYVDQGGGVVMFTYETYETGSYQLKGRYMTDYAMLPMASLSGMLKGPVTLGAIKEQGSSLLTSVAKYSCVSTSSCYHLPGPPGNGGVVVAELSDKSPFIVRGEIKGHRVLEINGNPSSSAVYSGGWDPAGSDMPQLIANAATFVSGGGGVSVDKPTIAFGDQAVGTQSGAQKLVFTNGGQMPQVITGVALTGTNPANFKVDAPGLPATLNPGGTYTANVTFAPLEAGPLSATLETIVQGAMSNIKVQLTGNAIGPTVVLSPNPLNFGGIVKGDTGTATFTIANTGGGTANVTKIEVTTDAASFTATPQVMPPFTLAPTASIPVEVKFSSMVTGSHLGVITVTTNVGAKTITLQATTGDPQITINNGTVIFGNQHVGITSTPAVFTIKNTGFANLTISDITSTGTDAADFIVQAKLPLVVLPGNLSTYGVAFKPSKVGGAKATITLTSNDPVNKSLSFDVAGSGVDFNTSVNPASLDFGTVKGGSTTTKQVTVTNMSAAPLGVLMADFTGAQAGSFSLVSPPMLPLQIAANSTYTFSIAFKASAGGNASATFNLVLDDPNKAKVQVALSAAVSAGALDLDPTSIDFAGVAIGDTSAKKEIVMTNKGNDALNVTRIALSGPQSARFALDGVPMSTTKLAPNDKLSVFVTFSPTTPGAASAQVDITTDDPMMSSSKVLLKGVGSQPGISVSPLELDFKLVPVGTISDGQTVEIKNTGDADLKIRTVVTSNAQFFVDNKGPFTVPAGKSTNVTVKFNPQAPGSATGDMAITPDSTDLQPVTISLRGVGAQVGASATPKVLTWGIVNVGTKGEAKTVTITNTSQTSLTLAPITSSNPVFTIDTTGTKTDLAPNATTTFAVTFEPKVNGPTQGSISITLAQGGKLLDQVSMSGEGLVVKETPPDTGGSCSVARTTSRGGLATFALALAALALLVRRRRR